MTLLLMNRVTADIETQATYSSRHSHQGKINEGQQHLRLRLRPVAPVEEEPEPARNAICEPAGEQTGHESQQIIEIGDTKIC
jgi:hypothetical protein